MGQMHGDKMNCAAHVREFFQLESDSSVTLGLWPDQSSHRLDACNLKCFHGAWFPA